MSLLENLLTLIFVALTASGNTVPTQTFQYSETVAILANPERGLYLYGEDELDHSHGCWWNDKQRSDRFVSALEAASKDHIRLVYLQYDLGEYRRSPVINPIVFDCIQKDFLAVRDHGFKVILRFAYNHRKKFVGGDSTEYDTYEGQKSNPYEASADVIKHHLDAPEFRKLVRDNADLITVWQAGFLGRYGEWYFTASDEGLPEKPNMNARAILLAKMLEILPAPGIVQVRTPYYRQYALKHISMLGAANRLGIFNDALLDVEDAESGTYSSYNDPQDPPSVSEDEKFWRDNLRGISVKVPVGGESSDRSKAAVPSEQDEDKILEELATYHWSYFNELKLRKTGSTDWSHLRSPYDSTIEQRLGYRLWLRQASFPQLLKKGESMKVDAIISNSGWAAPISPRRIRIFLCGVNPAISGGSDCGLMSEGQVSGVLDVKSWLSGGSVALSALIPTADLKVGNYHLYLALTDVSSRLSSDPRYSIRLANNENAIDESERTTSLFSWNEALGYNRIGVVTIR